MERFASVMYEGVLAAGERDSAARSLRSHGATVTSWSVAGNKTFAFVALNASAAAHTFASGARIDEPPLVVLRIRGADAKQREAVVQLFAGPAAPRGIVYACAELEAAIVAFSPRVTSLAFVVTQIDVELARAPARRIDVLLPLDDETLARFAGELLGEPELDATRLIETHLQPLLAGDAP